MVNSCIIAHTLFTLSCWKWGCRLQDPPFPFQTNPQFWPPPYNTQQLQFRSLPKIELFISLFVFTFALSFCKPSAYFSLSRSFLNIYIDTHIHTHSRSFHIVSIEFFPFLSSLSLPFCFPFWMNDLFCPEGGYFCDLSFLFYFHMYRSWWVFSALQRTLSNIHFCHLGGWLHR
jgi:hypothetical protein